VSVANDPGDVTDWVGVYPAGQNGFAAIAWQYLNGSQTSPAEGQKAASLTFALPSLPGPYDFVLYAKNGYTVLATSNIVNATTGTFSCTPGYKMTNGSCAICSAPRHYQYSLSSPTALKCSPTETKLLQVQVPDHGYALARATMVFANSNSQSYYWNANLIVGDSANFANGDDICPKASTTNKISLGYGLLNANSSTITLQAYQGSSPCIDGQVTALAGSSLDVWVEDPAPDCQKRDINMITTYNTLTFPTPSSIAQVYPASTYPYFAWTNSMSILATLPVPVTSGRSQMLVLSSVEGTTINESNSNNYTCGQSAPPLISQIASNDLGILAQGESPVPTLGGQGNMGHLVNSSQTSSAITYDSSTMNWLELLVGSNLSNVYVTTGGCCGDGKIGFVKVQ